MPSAVTFILGADSAPFSREMRQMEAIAQSSGRNIGARMAQGAHFGYSSIIREAITIPREIIEGRGIGRVVGSSSILLQALGRMITGSKEVGAANRALSDSWDLLATKHALAAKKSIEYAAEMSSAMGPFTRAQQAMINGARLQAEAEGQAALAYKAKATAAAEAAQAEEVEAAIAGQGSEGGIMAGVSTFLQTGIGAAIVAIGMLVLSIGVLWYRWRAVNKEAEEYSKKLRELFESAHMTSHIAGVNSLADAWARVAENVRNASDEYGGAIQSGSRLMQQAEATSQFESRMAELQHRLNLSHARTPAQRDAENERYASEQDSLLQLRHARERSALDTTEARARREATTLRAQAAAMRTPGGMPIEEDHETRLANAKRQAEIAEKWLKDNPAMKPPEAFSFTNFRDSAEYRDKFLRDQGTRQTMQSYIAALGPAQQWARDQEAGQRARQHVTERVQADEERANSISNDRRALMERQRLEEERARQERNLELGLEESEGSRRGGRYARGQINAMQRQGFSYLYGAPQHDEGLALARRSEQHLMDIDRQLQDINHHTQIANRTPPGAGRR